MGKNQPTVNAAMQPGLSARVGEGLRNHLALSAHQYVQSPPALSSDTGAIHRKTLKNACCETFPFSEVEACCRYPVALKEA